MRGSGQRTLLLQSPLPMVMVVVPTKADPKADKREAVAIPIIRITAVTIVTAVVTVTVVRRTGVIGVVVVAVTIAVIDIAPVVMPSVVGFFQEARCHWPGGTCPDLPRGERAGGSRRCRQGETADCCSSYTECHFRRARFDHGKIPP
jgi:hypothetical protein